MQNEVMPYLFKSLLIIKNNVSPIAHILAASTLFIIPFSQNKPNALFFIWGFALLFFLYPSVYGQYAEITTGNKKSPYTILFKRHCLNFVIVSFFLVSPLVILSLLEILSGTGLNSFRFIYMILMSSLSIYILPLLFLHGKKWESITLGIQCIAGNLNFNLPLILIASTITVLTLTFGQSEDMSTHPYRLILYSFFWLLGYVVEFWLYITAILILQDKGLTRI